MVAVAIGGSAIIGAVATSSAASKAAKAQTQAAQTASNTELNMYGQNKDLLNPYIQGGTKAYQTLNDLLGVGGNSQTMQDTLNNLPGYQFTLGQGLKSTQNSAAARGLGSSGAALKGAATYATGLAQDQYGNYVNQLQGSATTGENAANALAGYGTITGSNVASNQIGAGNAQAAAANATGGAISNAANSVGQFYTLKNILNSQNSTNGDFSFANSANFFGGT